ncbi:glycosyltransferase [Photobacterium atrarenae]|uniref:Glycosyltransferase n=1 Tax=Photobacterium atrarenae TaxID=865757 RepID=A0ABY5GPJ0_9GAMM|nr:glycosyltransferase [Photobacterium atrarenae]UTV30462.1 glycosyltransferase [Photobacterium atrarenae]
MARLKILRVISSVDPTHGGPIYGLTHSSKLLVEKGHHIEVLSLDDPNDSKIRGFNYPLTSFRGMLGKLQFSYEFSSWLDHHVSEFDVVITHGIWQYHSYATAKACRKHNIPYVVFTHGMLDPWFNQVDQIKALKKKIYWKLFESYTVNNSNAVLFTSQEEKALAKAAFLPYSPAERVVAYGTPQPNIDIVAAKAAFFRLAPQLQGKRIALYLGRIHQKKGIDLMLKALGNLAPLPEDFMLVIAGPDQTGLKEELDALSHQLGITKHIIWTGMLQGHEKWGAYYASDVFILPSHQENFGLVIAEALSTGTPVLTTNKVNIWHEVDHDQAGYVAPDTVAGIQSLLSQWFALSPNDRISMCKRALKCYSRHFSLKAAAQDLEAILLEVRKAHSTITAGKCS